MLKHCIFFCLLSYSNISSTTLSSPLCFLTRNYSAQRAALIGLIIQEFVTHACAHLCLCTRIITDSGSKAVNNDSRGRHRHGISTLRKLTLSAPTLPSYILSFYLVSRHLQQYFKGLIAEQMAVMIHHFSAIQKQQLLCWHFMYCGKMVCKMIPFFLESCI